MIFKYFFGIWMWLGLSLALCIALMPLLGFKWFPNLLLFISLAHMLSLSGIAWKKVFGQAAVDNMDIGNRLATTGYIHTLIGTCAALIAAADFDGSNMNEIQQIIKPIGAALGTSIIGWWMGNEIQWAIQRRTDEEQISYRNKEMVEKAFEILARSVLRLSYHLNQSGAEWKKNVENLRGKLDDVSDQMVQTYNDLNDQVNHASTGLSVATSTVSQLSTHIEQSLTATKTQLEKLSDSLESSVTAIAEESAKTSTSMKTISSEAETTVAQINQINESLKRAAQIISEADKLLAQMRRERERRS